MRLGALEAGGTKMVCAIGDETGKIFEQVSVPTQTNTYVGNRHCRTVYINELQ